MKTPKIRAFYARLEASKPTQGPFLFQLTTSNCVVEVTNSRSRPGTHAITTFGGMELTR